jgi:hypothetical protein
MATRFSDLRVRRGAARRPARRRRLAQGLVLAQDAEREPLGEVGALGVVGEAERPGQVEATVAVRVLTFEEQALLA